MNAPDARQAESHPQPLLQPLTYPDVLRLLGSLNVQQLHSLRMYAIPAELKRRRGVTPVLPAKDEQQS